MTTDSVWLLQHRLLFQFVNRKSVCEIRKRHHETAPKKYPRIRGNVSKDKRASIQGYFAKYPCYVFSTCLPLGGSWDWGAGGLGIFEVPMCGFPKNNKCNFCSCLLSTTKTQERNPPPPHKPRNSKEKDLGARVWGLTGKIHQTLTPNHRAVSRFFNTNRRWCQRGCRSPWAIRDGCLCPIG